MRLSGTGVQFFGSFEQGAVMQGRFRSRSIAVGGIFVMVTLTAGALIEPAHAQAQQVNGFNAFVPQWALANSYMFSGLNGASNIATGTNQQAYTAPFGSGTVGLFVESNVRDGGAGSGTSGNWYGPLLVSPTSQREDWFANLGNPEWRTSVFGSYKSAPNAGLFNGLYTTAGFGVTSIRTNPLGFSGLPNFSNDVAAVTARAGLGLQVTPQITVEGSVSWTQVPTSTFR